MFCCFFGFSIVCTPFIVLTVQFFSKHIFQFLPQIISEIGQTTVRSLPLNKVESNRGLQYLR